MAVAASPEGDLERAFVGVSESLATGSEGISPEGLVLAYDMRTLTKENAVVDFSGSRNDGRIFGTEVVPGPFGPARRFQAPGDYVRLPHRRSLHLRGPLSIAAWLRFSQLGAHQHIVSYDDLYSLWIGEKNRFRFADTRANYYESEPDLVSVGEWCALVATFSGRPGTPLHGENISLFVNGRRAPGRAVGVWKPGRVVEGFVAKESHGGQFYLPFRGEIASLLLFRRSLSADEAWVFSNAGSRTEETPSGLAAPRPDIGGPMIGMPNPARVAGAEHAIGSRQPLSTNAPRVRITPRIVRIVNLLPPYRQRQHEILRDNPDMVFETWLMTRSERNRKWEVPLDPTVRVFRDVGIDLSHRDMFTVHFNPGMARELSRRPPGLVLLGGYEQPTCIFVGLLLDRMRVPFLVLSESVSLGDSPLGRRAPFLVRALLRRCAGVIVSGRTAMDHALALGVPEDRIFVASPSVDVSRFVPPTSAAMKKEIRDLLGLSAKTVCLYVGRLVPWKGIDDLLDAFSMLRPSDLGLHLQLVGDGPSRAAVESRVAADPILRGNVTLTGHVSEETLEKFYAAADIFVFPTRRDVWGLVLNEAMSAGLAVVASDGAAAARELIEDGTQGVVVPAGRPEALADALRRLHGDRGLRERMGIAARERILSGFTPRHQAQGIVRAVTATLMRLGRWENDGDDPRGALNLGQ